ncbi:RNA polymerase I-specific transcription initiation factor RRN3 [Boletus reticuloceps]|uniref:RNA polymerase I-specific transcription initiation factor RRN3 n=1 Tax=Boletus reticuloceps TaxID=495285 RepID=A0A8I2YLB1_9AGAM|nr:RNA polymerase I-specific transcription initiation factor RRN3 [Boletus reticuloceps]
MDPHSTHSQFNQRTPKSGPFTPTTRFMDQPPKITIERYAKPPSPAKADRLLSLAQRPIATNSRVRQGEQFKRDMFVAFINKALQEKLNGHSKDFDDLVDQFNPRKVGKSTTSSSQLRLWVLALSHVLSKLERRHGSLVEAIVNLPWTTMDTTFVKSYTVFIGMLLSARPEYLAPVLSKIAQGLTYRSRCRWSRKFVEPVDAQRCVRPLASSPPSPLVSHTHPSLNLTTSPRPTFPHKRQSQVTQVTYIRNLLRVTEYCSELTDRILALIIDRALQIDVEIQVELEELEQDDTLENGDVFEFDPFDVVVGQEGDEEGSDVGDDDLDSDVSTDVSSDDGSEDDKEPDLPSNVRHMQEMVNKLDHILKLIFDHFNRLHYVTETPIVSSPTTPHSDSPFSPLDPPQSLSPESRRAMRAAQFYTLLAIFDRAIIRTFKSRYTQFLLFWYSSLDPEFSDLFQGLLVEKALIGQDVPIVTRAAAASYIASFVSRAQFVDREGARRMVTVLCTFLQNHLDAFDKIIQAGQEPPSLAHHSVFYAIVQAVFLIFCFRWRDLQEEFDEVEAYPGRKKWMNELDVVQRVITSPLNPLKVCSSNVVMQFARIAQATNFVYCHSIIEANRRSEYNPSPGSLPLLPRRSGEELVSAELHTFFPFDPYRLPRSGSYIQAVYREWSSVAIEGDEESDEEEDGEDVDEGDGEFDHVGMLSVNPNDGALGSGGLQIPRAAQESSSDADGLGESFGGMSISPAQPRSVIMTS